MGRPTPIRLRASEGLAGYEMKHVATLTPVLGLRISASSALVGIIKFDPHTLEVRIGFDWSKVQY